MHKNASRSAWHVGRLQVYTCIKWNNYTPSMQGKRGRPDAPPLPSSLVLLPFAPLAPVFWCPLYALWVNAEPPLPHRTLVPFQHVAKERDDVLTLVVLHQLEVLKRGHHILLSDACLVTDLTAATKRAVNL